MKVMLMVIKDSDEHEVPEGWYPHSAVTLRNTGAQATVGLILVAEDGDDELIGADEAHWNGNGEEPEGE